MGKYNEALEIFYSVEKIRTEILGINHPNTIGTKHNIAICLKSMGKYNEALEICYSDEKIQTEILGINHPDTIRTKHSIAICLKSMGKYNEALEIYYSVEKIQTEILGINHLETIRTKHNIAICLYDMGKYNEALEIYYSVEKIQTEILGINHPETIRTTHNIATCLDDMGKYNEALEIYYSVEKIQTEILGINHPETTRTKHNIANCLNDIGKYNEALEICYSDEKIQTEILGINHPDTIRTKHSIAICLKSMGKYNEALEIYYSVEKIRTEILDYNKHKHPLQFGFTKSSSTLNVEFVISETIKHYNNNNSPVYLCSLDAEKANASVSYLDCKSYPFYLRQGMRQRSILSPHFSNIYTQNLLETIQNESVDLIPAHKNKPVNQICIFLRAGEINHLLGAPGVTSGIGLNQLITIKSILTEFDVADHIRTVCFDTTASNTRMIRLSIYRPTLYMADIPPGVNRTSSSSSFP
ncbi:kinesin light chain 2-like [Hydra vulgaris]|uniref:kinesin light chain 2-like n=1 Tax=Hydra vulgaris TaxID=6087 RepID=UPI0032E9F865